MNTLLNFPKVKISQSVIHECFNHARNIKCHYDNWYTERSYRKKIAIGKIGEFGAAYILNRYLGYPLAQPDLSIYDVQHKTYDADLKYIDHPCISVKSSLFVNQYWHNDDYQNSWLLNKKEPQKYQTVLALVHGHTYNNTVEVELFCAIEPDTILTILEQPKADCLRKDFHALYENDIRSVLTRQVDPIRHEANKITHKPFVSV